MECTICHEKLNKANTLYRKESLLPYCTNCLPHDQGVNQVEVKKYLDLFPAVKQYANRSMSARFDIPTVAYILRYAQTHKFTTLNQALRSILKDTMENDPLEDVQLLSDPLKRGEYLDEIPKFLQPKEVDKHTVDVGKPKKKKDDTKKDDNDKDEDVFII